MRFLVATFILGAALPVAAQLTVDQKIQDFRHLAGLYATSYAGYEWKRDVIGFDLMSIGSWLDRVRKTQSDVEFLEVCKEYVASLRHHLNVFPFAQSPSCLDRSPDRMRTGCHR